MSKIKSKSRTEVLPQETGLRSGRRGALGTATPYVHERVRAAQTRETKHEAAICSSAIIIERVGLHPGPQTVFQGTVPRLKALSQGIQLHAVIQSKYENENRSND